MYVWKMGCWSSKRVKKRNWSAGRDYSSARIKTQGLHAWQYGRIEARIKLPYGQGIWPAFWMLGDNLYQKGWPAAGEIDIHGIHWKRA